MAIRIRHYTLYNRIIISDSMRERIPLAATGRGGQLLYSVGIFALIGVGLGLVGFVVLTQSASGNNMADAIVSGIFSIMILVIALFLGPVIAAIVGIQMGNRNQSSSVYFTSFVGNTIGYIVMMLIVLAILSIGIGLVSNGGGSSTMGGTTGEVGASGGGGFGQWVFPIIAISVITGLTGTGARYLQIQANQMGKTETGDFSNLIPLKGILAVLLVCGVLLVSIYGSSALLSGDPSSNLEVTGEAYSQNNILYGSAVVENVGDSEATATLTIRLLIDGQERDDFTSSTEVTLDGDESTTETLEMGRYGTLPRSEINELNAGNWTIEFLIDGEVKDTYTE